jgi:Cu-Zn family superoxide dismutase
MIVRVGPVVILAGLLACHSGPPGPGGVPLPAPAASATLKDSTGARIGVATLSAVDAGARLGVSVAGLPPGPHGIHIHERGVCTAPTSARPAATEPRGGAA